MAWASTFLGLGYRERAEFLHHYLKQLPESLFNYIKQQSAGLKQPKLTDPFACGYKDVFGYIVGGFCLRSEYRYISKNAKEHLKKQGIDEPVYAHMYNKKSHPEYKGLTHEHTIPVSMVVDYLILHKEQLTADYLEDFFKKVSGIALITAEDNKALDASKLRKNLPSGTNLDDILNGKKLHSARYDTAGIEMAVINHNAKA